MFFFVALKHFFLDFSVLFFLGFPVFVSFFVFILFLISLFGFWFSFLNLFLFVRWSVYFSGVTLFAYISSLSFLLSASSKFWIINCILLIDSIFCRLPRCKHKGPKSSVLALQPWTCFAHLTTNSVLCPIQSSVPVIPPETRTRSAPPRFAFKLQLLPNPVPTLC
jgi:hypothetical protein